MGVTTLDTRAGYLRLRSSDAPEPLTGPAHALDRTHA